MALISVVIPVYKAQECLDELYRQLTAALGSITEDYEIVMVEDCGGDQSWEIIARLADTDPRVHGLQLSRNFGQHYGITAGLDNCDGDWVVVMDCDLQDDPAEIPKLYAKALEGYDVVLARRGRRADSLLKSLTSRLFYRVFGYLADIDYDGEVGNFRIVSRRVVESLRLMREKLRFFGGLVAWVGFPTASVDVVHGDRFAGETSYSFAKLWRLAVEIIIAHSDKPLRLAVKAGFFLSLAAFVYGGYIAYRALVYGVPITGWSSLIVSIYFLGGIIISLLGVLGVYLGKTFDESKRRPLYIVRRTTAEAARMGRPAKTV